MIWKNKRKKRKRKRRKKKKRKRKKKRDEQLHLLVELAVFSTANYHHEYLSEEKTLR